MKHLIPAPGRQKQGDLYEFKTNLDYMVRPYLRNKNKTHIKTEGGEEKQRGTEKDRHTERDRGRYTEKHTERK